MTPFEAKIESVVDSILSDYAAGRDIDKIERIVSAGDAHFTKLTLVVNTGGVNYHHRPYR